MPSTRAALIDIEKFGLNPHKQHQLGKSSKHLAPNAHVILGEQTSAMTPSESLEVLSSLAELDDLVQADVQQTILHNVVETEAVENKVFVAELEESTDNSIEENLVNEPAVELEESSMKSKRKTRFNKRS